MTTSPVRQADALAAQPRALIVTIYGLYAREAGDWLSIGALIRLMAELGVDEPAVRSAISRLKQRGMLEPRRQGGTAGYGLSARGQAALAEGDRRIFGRPRAGAADGWLLAVFSVPEQQRSKRHALRSRLAWLGFGTVSAGVWIAPGHLADETSDLLQADGLSAYVSLFTADYLAFGPVRDHVSRWWDLDRLEQLYQSFIDSAAPVLAQWESDQGKRGQGQGGHEQSGQGQSGQGQSGQGQGSHEQSGQGQSGQGQGGGAAFADYVRVLTAWRRLPFLDPGLSPELLPGDWHGFRAEALFTRLRELLGHAARSHALSVAGVSPTR